MRLCAAQHQVLCHSLLISLRENKVRSLLYWLHACGTLKTLTAAADNSRQAENMLLLLFACCCRYVCVGPFQAAPSRSINSSPVKRPRPH
jgi:hypothetical protein